MTRPSTLLNRPGSDGRFGLPPMPELADPELTKFIADFNAMNSLPPAAETGADALRGAALERVKFRPKGPELQSVDDVTIGSNGPTVRIYRPRPVASGVVVYFHGAGWTFGDLETPIVPIADSPTRPVSS